MPVKEVPVPTGEEDAEAVTVEHDADVSAESEESSKEEKVEEIAPKRRLTGKQKPPAKAKAVVKSASRGSSTAKAAKEALQRTVQQDKIDLKQRMPCPICKKMYTLHSLLYTHQCMKDAREAKAKKKAPEILIPELEKTPPPKELAAEPLSPMKPTPQPEEPPNSPPPLVRQSNQTIPPPTNGIREQLIQRRFALDAARRAALSMPIRKFYGK